MYVCLPVHVSLSLTGACKMSCAGAVELMRTMMAKSKKRGHLWPMAMYSWEVMPPPAGLEKNLGERRLTGYAGTGWQPITCTNVCCIVALGCGSCMDQMLLLMHSRRRLESWLDQRLCQFEGDYI